MALQLAEMQSFLQNRTAEDEYIQQQIQDTFKELSKYVHHILNASAVMLMNLQVERR